eukprot:25348-Eustigmatos_ZCMA.PRE.1
MDEKHMCRLMTRHVEKYFHDQGESGFQVVEFDLRSDCDLTYYYMKAGAYSEKILYEFHMFKT